MESSSAGKTFGGRCLRNAGGEQSLFDQVNSLVSKSYRPPPIISSDLGKPDKRQKTEHPVGLGNTILGSPSALVESPTNIVIAISGNTFNHFGDQGLSMEPPSMGPQQSVQT